MRCKTLLISAVLGTPSLALAQGYGPSDRCLPTGNCPPPCQDQYREEEAGPLNAPLAGTYAQPAAVGEQRGAMESSGVRGLRLRFPAFNLELPSLELPGRYHVRRGPDMLVNESVAPYVAGQAATYGMLSAGGQALSAEQLNMYQLRLSQDQGQDAEKESAPFEKQTAPCDDYNGGNADGGGNDGAAPPAPPAEPVEGDEELEFLLNHLQELEAAVSQLAASRQAAAARSVPARRPPVGERPRNRNDAQQVSPDVQQHLANQQAEFEARYAAKCRELEQLRSELNRVQQPPRTLPANTPLQGQAIRTIMHVEEQPVPQARQTSKGTAAHRTSQPGDSVLRQSQPRAAEPAASAADEQSASPERTAARADEESAPAGKPQKKGLLRKLLPFGSR